MMPTKYHTLFLLLILGMITRLPAQPRKLVEQQKLMYQAIMPKPVIKQVQIPGGPMLEYAEQGDASGIPVILLHGFTDSWHSFETVMPFLPANVHVYAITQRGHGNSTKPAQQYQVADFAADIAALIHQLKLGPCFIVGHSMGGLVAQEFALTYPHLTHGLVLAATDANFNDNPGIPEFRAQVMQLADPVPYDFAHAFQASTCYKPIDKTFFRMLVMESLKVPAPTWKLVLKHLLEVDYSPQLGRLNIPTLIIGGSEDSFCRPAEQHLLQKAIPKSRLVIYEGYGHALHWEDPARFANDLVKFFTLQ